MTLLDKTNTLIIVPAYNEQDSVVAVIEEIKATGFPFVVIDDGSTDETRHRAISAGARTISLPFNSGVGGSLKCGFQYAVKQGYRAVIQCDADGQHPTSSFGELVQKANLSSSHLVIGNRFGGIDGNMYISKSRLIAIKMLAKVFSIRAGINIRDTTSGFRLISYPLLNLFAEEFPRYYLGDTYEALVFSAQKKYQISEIGVTFRNRAHGVSTSSNAQSVGRILQLILEPVITRQNYFFNKRQRGN
jgi:glycosyltransferase involved in cell wall biosynthesis